MKRIVLIAVLLLASGCMNNEQRTKWFVGLGAGLTCAATLGPISPAACPALFYGHAELTAEDEAPREVKVFSIKDFRP